MFVPIPINTVTFALPARKFVIQSSVTVNESLPKVTEFALRLIRVCEDIEAEQFAQYFGFTDKETRLLLDSLVDQSLIQFDGASIRLTEYAESKFYTDDDLPRFSVVKPRTDAVDFDLLTFHPLKSNSSQAPGYAVELNIDQGQVGDSTRLAEQAYQTHFQQILRAKEKNNDRIDIYKISHVKSDRLFGHPVNVGFFLNEELEVERQINHDEEAATENRLGIEAAVSDALRLPLRLQNNWLADFVERFDDKLIGQFLSQKGFDFQAYVNAVHVQQDASYSGATQPMIGNMYMPLNAARILAALKPSIPVIEGEGTFLTSAVWLAPESRFWARSQLFDELYSAIQRELSQSKKKSNEEEVKILYPGSREMIRDLQNMFWSKNGGKAVHFHEGNFAGGRVEILLVPLCFACVLFHYAPSSNTSSLVPFGFMTTEPKRLKAVQVAVNEATDNGRHYVGKANYAGEGRRGTPVYAETFGFLSYCAI